MRHAKYQSVVGRADLFSCKLVCCLYLIIGSGSGAGSGAGDRNRPFPKGICTHTHCMIVM